MGTAILLVASLVGVDYGWYRDDAGKLVYLVQVDPEQLAALEPGQELSSALRPDAPRPDRIVIRVGRGPVPQLTDGRASRLRTVETRSPGETPSASGSSATSPYAASIVQDWSPAISSPVRDVLADRESSYQRSSTAPSAASLSGGSSTVPRDLIRPVGGSFPSPSEVSWTERDQSASRQAVPDAPAGPEASLAQAPPTGSSYNWGGTPASGPSAAAPAASGIGLPQPGDLGRQFVDALSRTGDRIEQGAVELRDNVRDQLGRAGESLGRTTGTYASEQFDALSNQARSTVGWPPAGTASAPAGGVAAPAGNASPSAAAVTPGWNPVASGTPYGSGASAGPTSTGVVGSGVTGAAPMSAPTYGGPYQGGPDARSAEPVPSLLSGSGTNPAASPGSRNSGWESVPLNGSGQPSGMTAAPTPGATAPVGGGTNPNASWDNNGGGFAPRSNGGASEWTGAAGPPNNGLGGQDGRAVPSLVEQGSGGNWSGSAPGAASQFGSMPLTSGANATSGPGGGSQPFASQPQSGPGGFTLPGSAPASSGALNSAPASSSATGGYAPTGQAGPGAPLGGMMSGGYSDRTPAPTSTAPAATSGWERDDTSRVAFPSAGPGLAPPQAPNGASNETPRSSPSDLGGAANPSRPMTSETNPPPNTPLTRSGATSDARREMATEAAEPGHDVSVKAPPLLSDDGFDDQRPVDRPRDVPNRPADDLVSDAPSGNNPGRGVIAPELSDSGGDGPRTSIPGASFDPDALVDGFEPSRGSEPVFGTGPIRPIDLDPEPTIPTITPPSLGGLDREPDVEEKPPATLAETGYLIVSTMGLIGSLGLNAYMGLVVRGIYRRYRHLIRDRRLAAVGS